VENPSRVPVVSLEWEEQYARLCEAARSFIFRVNAEGHLTILTPPLATLAGWPAREWATRPVVELLHPDDVEAGKQAIARVLQGEVPEPFEIRLRTPTGSYRHVLCTVLPEEDEAHRVHALLGLGNDITDRVRAQEGLRRAERLLRMAEAIAGFGSGEWRVGGEAVVSSEGLFRVHGLEPGPEPLRRPALLARVHREDSARVEAEFRSAESEAGPFGFDYRIERADGAIRLVECRGESLAGRDGAVERLVATCLDVTTRRERNLGAALARLAREGTRADADLDSSLRLLTETAALALDVPRVNVWVFGPERDRLRCVDAFEAGRGHSLLGDLVAERYPSYFRALEELRTIDVFDARSDPRTRELRETYLDPHRVSSFLDAPILLSGRVEGVVCHEQTERPRDWTAEEKGFAASIADLVSLNLETDRRRQAEKALRDRDEQHRFLLETAQAVVWRGDPSTLRFTFVSREAQALLGYPVDRWTLEPDFFRERVHPEDRDWAVASRAAAGRESRDHQVEFRMLAANGRVVWVRDIVRIVRDVQGRGIESVGVMIDVTERRGAEEELRQSRERLRDLSAHVEWAREEERASISRSIHDDLGQALTALKFELAALRHGAAEGAPSADQLGRIDGMTELVMGTVDHVRRIAQELRPGLLDDLGLVAALEWQVQEFQDRTRIECRLQQDLGDIRLPRVLATTCFRTVQEALTNVARHSAAHRAEVRISHGPGRLLLEISDDGRGIDQDELRSARSLGLLGMKERARRLGGDVSVNGARGRGTTVALSVPWAEPGADPA
jgi:two-component system sensor histidine kinase UhpB